MLRWIALVFGALNATRVGKVEEVLAPKVEEDMMPEVKKVLVPGDPTQDSLIRALVRLEPYAAILDPPDRGEGIAMVYIEEENKPVEVGSDKRAHSVERARQRRESPPFSRPSIRGRAIGLIGVATTDAVEMIRKNNIHGAVVHPDE